MIVKVFKDFEFDGRRQRAMLVSHLGPVSAVCTRQEGLSE